MQRTPVHGRNPELTPIAILPGCSFCSFARCLVYPQLRVLPVTTD